MKFNGLKTQIWLNKNNEYKNKLISDFAFIIAFVSFTNLIVEGLNYTNVLSLISIIANVFFTLIGLVVILSYNKYLKRHYNEADITQNME